MPRRVNLATRIAHYDRWHHPLTRGDGPALVLLTVNITVMNLHPAENGQRVIPEVDAVMVLDIAGLVDARETQDTSPDVVDQICARRKV